MDIFQRVKKLGLPVDNIVIIGSGIMEALGLRQSHDIDLVVTSELFNQLKSDGWPEEIVHDEPRLIKDGVEIWMSWGSKGGKPNFDELTKESVKINGLQFSSPEYVMKWKRQYGSDNPKHLKDASMIEEYLKNER